MTITCLNDNNTLQGRNGKVKSSVAILKYWLYLKYKTSSKNKVVKYSIITTTKQPFSLALDLNNSLFP